MADNNRRNSTCGNMCARRDNNACERDAENIRRGSVDMTTRNCRENNARGTRETRCGGRRNSDMRCGMDEDMSNRCGNMNDMEGFALAMAYVPWQQWGEVYPLNTGLSRGTIFPELDKPFFKGRCCN